MRTTLDIDEPILEELKRLGKARKRSLSGIASDLLASALAMRKAGEEARPPVRWRARPMGARVDLSDTDAVYDAMDRDDDAETDRTP